MCVDEASELLKRERDDQLAMMKDEKKDVSDTRFYFFRRALSALKTGSNLFSLSLTVNLVLQTLLQKLESIMILRSACLRMGNFFFPHCLPL